MVQIAVIQVTPQSPPSGTTLAKHNPDQFTSHLKKAVAETAQTPQNSTANPQNSKAGKSTPAASQSAADSSAADKAGKNTPAASQSAVDSFAADKAGKNTPAASQSAEGSSAVAESAKKTAAEELVISKKELPLLFDFLEQTGFPLQALEKELSLLPENAQSSMQAAVTEISTAAAGTTIQDTITPLSPVDQNQPITAEPGAENRTLLQDLLARYFQAGIITSGPNVSGPDTPDGATTKIPNGLQNIIPPQANGTEQQPDVPFLTGTPQDQATRELVISKTVNPLLFDFLEQNKSPLHTLEKYISLPPTDKQVPIEAAVKEFFRLTTGKNFPVMPAEKNGDSPQLQPLFFTQNPQTKTAAPPSPLSAVNNDNVALKVDFTGTTVPEKNSPLISTPQNRTIFAQLQQIINYSNENDTVSIHGSINRYLLQKPGESATQPDYMVSGKITQQVAITENINSANPALRQYMLSQYLETGVITKGQGESVPETPSTTIAHNIPAEEMVTGQKGLVGETLAKGTSPQPTDNKLSMEAAVKESSPLAAAKVPSFSAKDIPLQPVDKNVSKEAPEFVTEKILPVLPGEKSAGMSISQTFFSSYSFAKTSTLPASSSPADKGEGTPKSDFTAATGQNKNISASPGVQGQTILQQLQQIINNNNETLTVSGYKTAGGSSQPYLEEMSALPGAIVSGQILQPDKSTERFGFKAPTLRQDMLGQYFDARISTQKQNDSGAGTLNKDQQNSANSLQSSTTAQQNSSISADQSSSFQHISTLMQDQLANQSHNSVKPIILPSGTVVHEDNVMQQVVERFRINTRGTDTRLSLKLHPEELGALKIDLTMKDGAIRANVVAQSQHVLQIIEKNMTRLRTVLEDQGFTVEEIVVTAEAESVPDFDLFEQHLSQKNDLSTPPGNTRTHNDFDGVLEDAFEQSASSSTGVNIQA